MTIRSHAFSFASFVLLAVAAVIARVAKAGRHIAIKGGGAQMKTALKRVGRFVQFLLVIVVGGGMFIAGLIGSPYLAWMVLEKILEGGFGWSLLWSVPSFLFLAALGLFFAAFLFELVRSVYDDVKSVYLDIKKAK